MIRFLFALLTVLSTGYALAAPVQTPHAEAELVAQDTHAVPGRSTTVALRLKHEPGWHTYWRNPGDSGMPTRIAWILPADVTAGPIQWPVPERIRVGPMANYGYEGELLLLTEITVPAGWPAGTPIPLEAKAEWLICKELCLPGGATLSLSLPTAAGPPKSDPALAPAFARTRGQLPGRGDGWRISYSVTDSHIVLDAMPPAGANVPPSGLQFFPDVPEVIDNPSPQTQERVPEGVRLLLTASALFTGKLETLSGVLAAGEGADRIAFEIAAPYPGGAPKVRATEPNAPISAEAIQRAAGAPAPAAPDLGLLLALAFAFGGGLVLNLMPCVFPVVSIKVLGFVEQAHGDRADLRNHGLAFAGGIVVCFWIVAGALLALRASGEALGWGYQLQSPIVVTALAVLFFLLGLNLSGWFEIGTRVQTLAGSAEAGTGLGGAFLSGMLATAVATPCTAPFMGAALGFALTQPALASMAVFTSLALGMGLPYVLLSFFPALTAWLPRPGRWMETLKQFLAFPLYLTVVWLVWVLGEQLGTTAAARLLAGLVLIAAAIWAWRRFTAAGGTVGAAIAALFVAAAAWLAWPTDEPATQGATSAQGAWGAYSDDELRRLRAEGPVFVDFTAAWCVTCQVNKRVVLQSDTVEAAFASRRFARLRADWTNRDEAITRALAKLGRSGVPVYAVYPGGGGDPELLPELLTKDLVLAALDRAARDRH